MNKHQKYKSFQSFFQTEVPSLDFSSKPHSCKKIKDSTRIYSIKSSSPFKQKSRSSSYHTNRLLPTIYYNQEKDLNKVYYGTRKDIEAKVNRFSYINTEEEEKLISKKMKQQSKINNVFVAEDKFDNYSTEKSIRRFNEVYKNLDRIKEKNKQHGIKDSIITEMFMNLEGRNLLPMKLGVVKAKGMMNEVALSHYKLGENYTNILCATLRDRMEIKKIDLRDNRLKSDTARDIFKNMSPNVKRLDLSQNSITKECCNTLSFNLLDNERQLLELNLEDNKLVDQSIENLLLNMKNNHTLKKLNLSKNKLTDASCFKIRDLLKGNDYLQELYLHWNHIKTKGGVFIFEGLVLNDSLKVLDLSWNSLGGQMTATRFYADYLKNDKKRIVHLDLSFNNFNLEESKIIQNAISENHNLLGFHFRGNFGFMDSKGYLQIPNEFKKEPMIVFAPKNRIKGVAKRILHCPEMNPNYKDCCWICDGWQEAMISLILENPEIQYLNIHFEFEEWQGIELEKATFKTYLFKKMLPKGINRFFFTLDEKPFALNNLPIIKMSIPLIIKKIKLDEEKQLSDIIIHELNYIKIDTDDFIVHQKKYFPLIECLPRNKRLIASITIPSSTNEIGLSSFFKNFVFEENVISKCFETDYKNTKIRELCSDEEENEKIFLLLKTNYKKIKDIYQYLAAIKPMGNLLCINQTGWSDFVKRLNLLDNEKVNITDLDLSYLNSYFALRGNVEEDEENNVLTKSLIRCLFLEVIVRLASDCFFRNGIQPTLFDSLQELLNNYILPYSKSFESSNWLHVRLFTSECEKVFKKFHQIYQYIFTKYSKKNSNYSKISVLNLYDFRKIFEDGNLVEDIGSSRDINLAFSLSIGYHENEINSERSCQLDYYKFLEAGARIAEKLSLHPIGDINIAEWPINIRMILPLHIKIESFSVLLMKRFYKPNILEIIGVPNESIFFQEINIMILKEKEKNSMIGKESEFKEKLTKSMNLSLILSKITDLTSVEETSPIL